MFSWEYSVVNDANLGLGLVFYFRSLMSMLPFYML